MQTDFWIFLTNVIHLAINRRAVFHIAFSLHRLVKKGGKFFLEKSKRERIQSGTEDAIDGEPSNAFPSEPNPNSIKTGSISKALCFAESIFEKYITDTLP